MRNLHYKLPPSAQLYLYPPASIFTNNKNAAIIIIKKKPTWSVISQIRRPAGLLQVVVVVKGCPRGRVRVAGGRARPACVLGEELVRGRINKPEIFQSELKHSSMEAKQSAEISFFFHPLKQTVLIHDSLCFRHETQCYYLL